MNSTSLTGIKEYWIGKVDYFLKNYAGRYFDPIINIIKLYSRIAKNF